MSSLLVDRLGVLGDQVPRVCSFPKYVSSAGEDAIECARLAGLVLDPWQEFVLERGLGERDDGRWASFEAAACVPRQNGKGGVIEALELAGLFVFDYRLVIYSAHLFDTAKESMRRLLELVESTPDFDRRVLRVSRSHGEEGIELRGGQRIRFRTRTKGGGRGLTGDLVVFDEAMFLPEATVGALLPTMAARPNPQAWYFGSAVDQLFMDDGVVFARLRERGLAGGDESLAYFEWSVDCDTPADLDAADLVDPRSWGLANPALGIRVSEEHVGNELRSMDRRTFAVERLGVGDWPRTDGGSASVIDPDAWAALTDQRSSVSDPVCFALDVTPDRSWSSIAVAGRRGDGLSHVEIVETGRGTGWVVERVMRMVGKHQTAAVVCDGSGPAGSLIGELERAGVPVVAVTAREHAQACGSFYDLVDQRAVRHLGQQALSAAVAGATKRTLGESWAWSRKNSTVDISPLVASTLALWGTNQAAVELRPFVL